MDIRVPHQFGVFPYWRSNTPNSGFHFRYHYFSSSTFGNTARFNTFHFHFIFDCRSVRLSVVAFIEFSFFFHISSLSSLASREHGSIKCPHSLNFTIFLTCEVTQCDDATIEISQLFSANSNFSFYYNSRFTFQQLNTAAYITNPQASLPAIHTRCSRSPERSIFTFFRALPSP